MSNLDKIIAKHWTTDGKVESLNLEHEGHIQGARDVALEHADSDEVKEQAKIAVECMRVRGTATEVMDRL